MLAAAGIEKSYGGVPALCGVSFHLQAGEVHALVGENGAGKSTLIKIFTGAVQPDAGELRVGGQLVNHLSPALAKVLGIAAIYQQPALFPDLTVAENLALTSDAGGAWRRIDWNARRRRAVELLRSVGAHCSPDALAGSLSMPEQQLVEIARSLGNDARILILDEPTASLNGEESQRLFGILHNLRARGVAILYISHRLEELFQIADRVSVLRDGRMIGTRAMADVTQGEMIRMMVGRELAGVFPERDQAPGEVVLETRAFRNVSLTLRRGEILGLAGMMGAGRTEFAEALFGLRPADGTLWIEGREVKVTSPADAIALGLAFVPEDRRLHGVVMDMPVPENITLSSLRPGFLKRRAELRLAEQYRERLQVKAASLSAPVRNLSGGNQQKVALARALATEPRILIVDEPTQGIDVGAKAEIYRLLSGLAAKGMAILMISSELPEILGMSDRIAVMRGGCITGVLNRAEANAERIAKLALGAAA